MTIIKELKKRSKSPSDSVKIELKLFNLVDDLVKKARNHLKRISNVLPEFDIHDEKHSEKVVFNIEKLLNKNVTKLSIYELFLIQLSSFFHDCAMAPSDWELNVLKFTEGTEKYKINNNSICHDLKEPLKISQAKNLIKENKNTLYKAFEGDVKNWMFSPENEDELIEYLSLMLIEYQNYRNGFAEQLRKINNNNDFENLNTFIRTDYIRASHHIRIEIYVNNLKSIFGNSFEQQAWGKKLAKDLALVCRSHGEEISYLENLNTSTEYYGVESANLQFVAMMLRLGDIIHFSFDRAPLDLRTSKLFKSEFSFLQWALKNNGANYSIENGKISFRAYCESPEIYFKLHNYLDWIEVEIQNYYKLDRLWNDSYKSYIPNLQAKIDRSNLTNDEKKFLPKRGLSFSLNQKRIIDLLMGVGLYKDKFACLRELYQNSLDACRCMIAEAHSIQHKVEGIIQFSIERLDDNVYLCCKDNGIGMTKEVIENYLLRIGNSYYKSSEFYKKQAQWGGSFTPTSQFGIGILSCFMLGNRIEIITKTKDGDFVSCAIDGPHENFYYRNTSAIEKEIIIQSGTVIKVMLSEEFKNISNKNIENLYLLLKGKPSYFPEHLVHYKEMYSDWKNHLYNKLNTFVTIIPENIKVEIALENGKNLLLLNKPILFSKSEFILTKEDFEFLNFLDGQRRFHRLKSLDINMIDNFEVYEIDIKTESLQFRTTLTLPMPGAINPDWDEFNSINIINEVGLCFDGVWLSSTHSTSNIQFYSETLSRIGILNFIGANKPQLTVDRTSLISIPSEYEKIAEDISKKLIQEVVLITKNHISKHHLKEGEEEYDLLWKSIFNKVAFADSIYLNELSHTKYGEIFWPGLEKATNKKISIKNFLKRKTIVFEDFKITALDTLTEKLILFKMSCSTKIDVSNNSVKCTSKDLYKIPFIGKDNYLVHIKMVIRADSWAEKYSEFDLVSSLFPLIPENLFNSINNYHATEVNNRVKVVRNYSNGIISLFDQDPLLVHETFGLYSPDSGQFDKNLNRVYQFDNKRSNFGLFELKNNIEENLLKEQFVLTAFIAPRQLTNFEKEKVESIKEKDQSYYNGVINGWSVLITGSQKYNMVILPNKKSREELVLALPQKFWVENKDIVFKFLNGKKMINNLNTSSNKTQDLSDK